MNNIRGRIVARMQCKSVVLAGVGVLVLMLPSLALAQNQSPFLTGATSLESNILACVLVLALYHALMRALSAVVPFRPRDSRSTARR